MNFAILSFIIGFILQFEALFLLLPWIVEYRSTENIMWHWSISGSRSVCLILLIDSYCDRLWNGFSDGIYHYHLLQKLWQQCALPVMAGKAVPADVNHFVCGRMMIEWSDWGVPTHNPPWAILKDGDGKVDAPPATVYYGGGKASGVGTNFKSNFTFSDNCRHKIFKCGGSVHTKFFT